jgi:hypothetical protein
MRGAQMQARVALQVLLQLLQLLQAGHVLHQQF